MDLSFLVTFASIAIIRMTPLGVVFSIPLGMVATLLWFLIGAPLGWKMAKIQ